MSGPIATLYKPKRFVLIPDMQCRPDTPTEHIDWIAQAIIEYEPDYIICIGDWFDMASLNSHEQANSVFMEGRRYDDDIEAGNAAFERLSGPIERHIAKRRYTWEPRKIVTLGNHEDRINRCASENPRLYGHISTDDCNFRGWEVYPFLRVVEIEGVLFSHYFQNPHSGRPIGGTIQNQLTKIGKSFVCGHKQGLEIGTKLMGSGQTWWGVCCGSAYTQIEEYRGEQGQRHWRGIVVGNEISDGEFSPMPVSLKYLCRKYAGEILVDYMARCHPYHDWSHLR